MVSYPDRLTYLTWYPSCLRGYSTEITLPVMGNPSAGNPLHGEIARETLEAPARIVPRLAAVDAAKLPDIRVKGGTIVAWGQTDIYDPHSELHNRYEIGITSSDCYHSIDPGKLTMAPYFADQCAMRICDGRLNPQEK